MYLTLLDFKMNPLFQSIISSPRIISGLTKRIISTSCQLQTMWERDEKGGYERELPPLKERLRLGLIEIKKEVKIWCQELKTDLEGDQMIITPAPGEIDIIYDFKDKESFKKWVVTCDADHNEGYSYCTLTQSNYGNGVFSGKIDVRVPKDGKVKRAGYCNIRTVRARKSFKRETYLDWTAYNTLVMKVRGDGRTYLLNIASRGFYDITWNDMYHYQLYTRGGPYWQMVKIPFSKFFFASKGRIQDEQAPLQLNKITSFGISAQDRHGGEFALEIEYIGLEWDPKHVEEFAYEQYKLERGLAGV